MRLALTAGGTGGHIIPALAVLDALQARGAVDDVRFFGPEDRGERAAVEARGLRFEPVPAAGVRGRGPVRLAKSLARLGWGMIVALRRLRAFRPDAVFSTGGYGSFPCSVAARLLRRPLVVYLPDVSPGWAVRAETRLATRMATTTEAALRFLPAKKTRVTGYPVRDTFFTCTREAARASLGIAPGERVVLVAGASQGARAINRAVFEALPTLVRNATVLHVTGAAFAQVELGRVTAAFIYLYAGLGKHVHAALVSVIVRLPIAHGRAPAHVNCAVHDVLHVYSVGKGAVGDELHTSSCTDVEIHKNALHTLRRDDAETKVHGAFDTRPCCENELYLHPISQRLRDHLQARHGVGPQHLVATDH